MKSNHEIFSNTIITANTNLQKNKLLERKPLNQTGNRNNKSSGYFLQMGIKNARF